MIIKSVKLHNIRSYLNQEVELPEGTVLLSGDIGSGKSTILLAIEFALFGISKGFLSGEALLRHGKQAGYVELSFILDSKEITIQRNLKRLKDSVRQEEGFLIVNGIKQFCTADELTAKVLEMLGYPKALLKKSKGLIYRFTVYTPQEEMKHILFEDPQVRLDTLRRVFQVEKYKLVKENTSLVCQALREKKKELSARIEDLPQKQEQSKALSDELKVAEKKLAALLPMIAQADRLLKEKQDSLKAIEEKSRQLNSLKSQLAATAAVISEKKSLTISREAEIASIKRDIARLKAELQGNSESLTKLSSGLLALKSYADSLTKSGEGRKRLEDELLAAEQQKSESESELGCNEALKQASQQLQKKIASIDNCPTCLQPVSGEHKHKIAAEEEAKVSALTAKSEVASVKKAEALQKIKQLKSELTELQAKEKLAASLASELKPYLELAESFGISVKPQPVSEAMPVFEMKSHLGVLASAKKKLDNLRSTQLIISEKEKLILVTEKSIESYRDESQQLETKKAELAGMIAVFGDIGAETSGLQSELDAVIKDRTALMMQKASFEKEKEGVSKLQLQLSDEISKKEAAKKELEESANISFWLDEMFLNVVSVIEKHVMVKVHQEFNEMFKEWFVLLMGNEAMTARIDDDFTPVVEADGYEIPVENLSGGEKTSCALAYRLALNMVINNLVSTIRTKDVLILDEPTDGFSSEQLDKLRDVLSQLQLPQIILVSHEDRIESFVHHVIRVEKDQHVSKIVA